MLIVETSGAWEVPDSFLYKGQKVVHKEVYPFRGLYHINLTELTTEQARALQFEPMVEHYFIT